MSNSRYDIVPGKLSEHVASILDGRKTQVTLTGKCDGREKQLDVKEMLTFIHNNAMLDRTDKLFPGDFRSPNALNVAYGAGGVLYALQELEGEVDVEYKLWFAQNYHPTAYPSGLYVGLAGIAWVAWEIGLYELAQDAYKHARGHEQLEKTADVFYGLAGVGLTALKLFVQTKDSKYLEDAIEIGKKLLRRAQESEKGLYWPDADGVIHLGYALGASGVALFLLYLARATNDDTWLKAGLKALRFDLSHVVKFGRLFGLPPMVSTSHIVEPYWFTGTAGLFTTLIRYYITTKEQELLEHVYKILPDIRRVVTAFPGLFRGLAGLGNALIDAYSFLGDRESLTVAKEIGKALEMYAVFELNGIGMPGDYLYRLSCDFGTGSAGVALFLGRLETLKSNFNFVLDCLL